MQNPTTSPKTLLAVCFTLLLVTHSLLAGGGPRRVWLTTNPETPALTPVGPNVNELAEAALKRTPTTNDHLTNPTNATPGMNPPLIDGNYLISPPYVASPESVANPNVPHGKVEQFTMNSADNKYFPGIARTPRGVFTTVDPNNPKTLVGQIEPLPYTRNVTVYIPAQNVATKPAPFIVVHDGPDRGLPTVLDNMIAAKRIPPIVAIMIANGGSDAQGSERGLEYDTMSGKFAEYIDDKILPLVEKNYEIRLTEDPEGRAVMGSSSGGSAALIMAWYHPEWYHRVITFSGTFVNQQWPFNPETPGGAWDFHDKLIPNSPVKPLRIWMSVGDADNYNPNVMRDDMHDWPLANNRMATVLRAKGYHYQYVFGLGAGHVDRAMRSQTLPEALEWVWQGYPKDK